MGHKSKSLMEEELPLNKYITLFTKVAKT